jgi:hypothetical protein
MHPQNITDLGFSRRTTRHVISLYEQISGKRKTEFVPFVGPHKAQILIMTSYSEHSSAISDDRIPFYGHDLHVIL